MSRPAWANRRVVEKALAVLPGGIHKMHLRGESALYEHELMRRLDEQPIGYAISANMTPATRRMDRRAARRSLET
jgi:hypothetical protein